MLLDQQKKIKGLQSQIDSRTSHGWNDTASTPLAVKRYHGQQELFDEADQLEPEIEVPEVTHTTGTSRQKKKKTRKPLPAELPRVKKVTERQCSCGCELVEIGESVSEQLDIVPATVQVIQTIRKKYACKTCEETTKTAPAPALLLPKSPSWCISNQK